MAYLGLSTIWDGPPRTLRYQIDSWQNQSWGFHDIARQRVRCEAAVASDGSRMNRCEHESFRHYFLRDGQGMLRTLYLRPENAAFQIDDAARTVHGGPCSCTWEPLTALPDDHECSQTAAARLPDGKRAGAGQIAGHAVVRYRSIDEKGKTTELSLAPGLACEVREEVDTWPGQFGIPGARWRYRVTSYQPGEPGIFQLPAGYALQQKEAVTW